MRNSTAAIVTDGPAALGERYAGRNVYVVDDDADLCESICSLLDASGFQAKYFTSAEQFLGIADVLQPGCLLCDLRMPGLDGLGLLEKLTERQLSFSVILMTGYGDVRTAVAAIRKGASDFVEKPFEDETVLSLIRRALWQMQDDLADDLTDVAPKRLATLSAREREVMERLFQGKPNKVIAFELKISIRTVEFHRSRLMAKMQAESLSELIRLGLAAGLPTNP